MLIYKFQVFKKVLLLHIKVLIKKYVISYNFFNLIVKDNNKKCNKLLNKSALL